jgi:hypothetical protein
MAKPGLHHLERKLKTTIDAPGDVIGADREMVDRLAAGGAIAVAAHLEGGGARSGHGPPATSPNGDDSAHAGHPEKGGRQRCGCFRKRHRYASGSTLRCIPNRFPVFAIVDALPPQLPTTIGERAYFTLRVSSRHCLLLTLPKKALCRQWREM